MLGMPSASGERGARHEVFSMKLRTSLQFGAIFPIIMATFVVFGLIARSRFSEQASDALASVETLVGRIVELENATRARVASPGEEAAADWQEIFDVTGAAIRDLKYGSFLEKAAGERIVNAHTALGEAMGSHEGSAVAEAEGSIRGDLYEPLATMITEGVGLERAVNNTAMERQREFDYVIAPLAGIVALLMAGTVLLVGRRMIGKLASIHAGMTAFTAGQYDYEIKVEGDEDIGDLAQAFNRMSRQVRQSHDELTEETRKQEAAAMALRKSNMMIADALERLRRAQSQIVDTERLSALKQVAGGIAHDLNSTLTPILGLTDFMLEYPSALDDREGIVDNLKTINSSVKKTRDQVKRLSSFFKPVDETDKEDVDLNSVLSEVVEVLRPKWQNEASAAGAAIEVTKSLGRLPPAHVNRFALSEVVTNLLLNAVDAMPGGGKISISTEADGKGIVLTVKDTGQGMTDEVRRRCFEPFFSTKDSAAAGMGLTVVHSWVKRHGGNIAIESKEGTGTTLTIRLPLDRREPGMDTEPEGKPADASRLNLLVIDDEQWVRRVFERILKSEGHNVAATATGLEGLELFKKWNFDAVLVDRAMPGMSGDEVAAAVKQHKPGTPVILLTGFGDLMKEEGECPPGVDIIVSKPASIEDLRRAIATVVKKPGQPSV